MPLGTIERKPPAFFKHGMSSLSKLVVFSLLAVALMVADARYGVTQPLRATISLLLIHLKKRGLGTAGATEHGKSAA